MATEGECEGEGLIGEGGCETRGQDGRGKSKEGSDGGVNGKIVVDDFDVLRLSKCPPDGEIYMRFGPRETKGRC